MDLIINLRKAFSHIIYYDNNHVYYDTNTRKKLKSVTSLISKYEPKFDAKYWSTYKALEASGYSPVPTDKEAGQIYVRELDKIITSSTKGVKYTNKTPAQIRKEWEYTSKLGRFKGTLLHDYLENKWIGKIYDKPKSPRWIRDKKSFDTSVNLLRFSANTFLSKHKHLIPIVLEIVVGNDKIAGQADALVYNTKTDKYLLLDYKTDKRFRYSNDYGDTYLSPISHMDTCEMNKYSLQLSIYRYLLSSKVSIDLQDSRVIWFNPNHPTHGYEVIEVPYLENEVKLLLK